LKLNLGIPVSTSAFKFNLRRYIMGFGRVYSGTLREGDTMYVITGAYDPSQPEEGGCVEVVINELYLMMGQGMFRVKQVPAGNILAIGGRGLHSSTILLNVSSFCGIRWAHDFPLVYWTGGHVQV